MENRINSKKLIRINQPAALAANICRNVIRELIMHSDKFNVSSVKFNSLVKAYYALESFPQRRITGYIDISANTHLPGGGLDYSSFTIGEDYFEIYTGFVSYEAGECDDSSWKKIFSSKDTEHRKNLTRALECWAESFLLHLDENPARSLLLIDRSQLNSTQPVHTEVKPRKAVRVPELAKLSVTSFDEVPF